MTRDDEYYKTFRFDEELDNRSQNAQRQDYPQSGTSDQTEHVRRRKPLGPNQDPPHEDTADSGDSDAFTESPASADEGTGEQLIRALQRFVAAQQQRLRHSEKEIRRLAQDNSLLISQESWFRHQISDRAQDDARRTREVRDFEERIKQREGEAHSLRIANETLKGSRKKLADEINQLKADKDAFESLVSNLRAEVASRDARIRELEETAHDLREGPRLELLERVRAAFPNAGIGDVLAELDDRTLHLTANALLCCLPRAGTPLDINALTAVARQFLANLRDPVFPGRAQVLDFAAEYFTQLAQTHKFKNVEGQQYSANIHQTVDAGGAVRPNQRVKTMLSFLVVRDKAVWSKAAVILES